MKKFISAWLILLCLAACEKPEDVDPLPAKPERFMRYYRSEKDTRTPRPGKWSGQNTYDLPGVASTTIPAWRLIRYLNNSDSLFELHWYSSPDSFTFVQPADTMRYTIVFDETNTSCGVQRTVWEWESTAYFRNDTMVEHGTVNYRWYYYGELRKQSRGTWQSWVTWERKMLGYN